MQLLNQKSKIKNQKFPTGFTLLELVVVVVIIGVLAMINMNSSSESLIADNPSAAIKQNSAIVDLANQAVLKENVSITNSSQLINKIQKENKRNLGVNNEGSVFDMAKKANNQK